jgi:CDP-diacylglycerol--glycerol-3-phosphate 3-phosphatidyltransferase
MVEIASPAAEAGAQLGGLRRRWWALAATSLALLLAGNVALRNVWPPGVVLSWAGLTAAVLLIQLTLLRRNLARNHRPDATAPGLLAGLGPGNLVTVGRGLAIAAFAGFLAAPLPLDERLAWAPALLYALGVLPDFLDGALARATNRVTVLGGILDMEYDSLAMLAVSVLAARLGKVPAWYVILGLARYLFVAGLWWRSRRGRPIYDLTPSNTRRLAAGFQMGFFCVALWPVLGPPATTIAGVLFVAPILVGFVRDWLVVSGALRPTAPGYQRTQRLAQIASTWLPPLLRGVGGTTAPLILVPAFWPAGGWAAGLLAGVTMIGAAGVLLGAGARLGAITLLLAACAALTRQGFHPAHGLLLASMIPLLYLGAGRAALWRGDDALFARRLGEPRDSGAVAQDGKKV